MCDVLCSIDGGLQRGQSSKFPFLAYRPQLTVCLGGIRGSQSESSQFGNQLVRCNSFARGLDDEHTATWRSANTPHWMEEVEVLDGCDALFFSVWVAGGPDGIWHPLREAVLSTATYHPHGFNGELPLQLAGKHAGFYIRLKRKMDARIPR